VSMLSGLACGLAPAVGATRPRSLVGFIKAGAGPGASGDRAQQRLRQILVVTEVALAFVLLTSAGLLVQSFFVLRQRVEAGFDSTNVLTAGLPIPDTRFKDPEALTAYLHQMARRIQLLPGIREVAFTDGLPTQGEVFGLSFHIADQPPVEHAQRPMSAFKTVSPSYFRAVGLRVLKGRALDERDRAGAPFAVVINETMARTYFRGADPIGQRLLTDGAPHPGTSVVSEDSREVVGVMADESVFPLEDRSPRATIYASLEQNPTCCLALVVRASLDPARLQESIRNVVSTFDRDQALTNMQPLDQLKTESVASDRLRSVLLGAFAAIAVALAAIGLYGVIAYAVVQRTREIGIRGALGASRASLVALVVRQGMTLTAWGLGVGFGGALVVSRLLVTLLFGVGPSDPTTMVAVAGTIAGVALLACYLPARRATRVNPSIALKSD
jgi:predicted permease